MSYRRESPVQAFFRSFFASILAIVVLVVVVGGVAYWKMNEKPDIDDHSYLVVDIYGDILEYPPLGGVVAELMGGEPETLHRVLANLEKAALDERIEGVVMKISSTNGAGYGMIEEMREGIRKVREAGKKVYAFSDAIDRRSLLLASACDSVFVPRTAYVEFMGFAVTSAHIRGTLEKLGIRANLHKIKDYKSAAEVVTRKDMSAEARENLEWMLDEYWDVYVEALMENRGLTEDEIVRLMEHALFTAEEAKAAGLVDDLLYWDELERRLKSEEDDELRTVSQPVYAEVEPEDLGLKGEKKIAVVHAQGMIAGRQSKVDPVWGVLMGHESVVADLRRARLDEDVAAVVFRVDSGGGEALASDLIGHEVEVVSGAKPIVVSMVDVAASGGYHVSYRATRIVADALTLTGSIGSISAKFNVNEFHQKLGITHDFVTKGPMALMWSGYRDFSERERERFEENHWADFNAWLSDIADHRGMTFEEAEKLAQGRVWSGRQGKANGLVDEVGGLDRAIALARELAEIPADEKVTVVHYPEPQCLVDMILGGGDVSAAGRWAVYRLIRHDLVETWNRLAGRPLCLMDWIAVE